MNRIFKLLFAFVVMVLMCSTNYMYAQTRQGTKRTTTTKKTTPAGKPVNLDGNFYLGILKVKDQPLDLLSYLDFSATDVNFMFNAGANVNIPSGYKAQEVNGKITVKLNQSQGVLSGTLTSKDKGESFEGTLLLRNKMSMPAWFLKVNREHTTPSLSDEELLDIVGNPDGYTAIIVLENNDTRGCFVADVTFNSSDKSYKVIFDNATLQSIFRKFEGEYEVEDKNLTLSIDGGATTSGKISDDGTYISLPMGKSSSGDNATLLLIR